MGADGQPNNTFACIKAKTAAHADGAAWKDTFKRSGEQGADKNTRVKGLGVQRTREPGHLTLRFPEERGPA